jgi:hypothetical protein
MSPSVLLRLIAVLVGIISVSAVSLAQLPPLNSGPSPVSPMANKNNQSSPTPVTPQNTGAPLFGQAWPRIGPDPAPHVGPANRCPPGYAEDTSKVRTSHLVVCVAAQPNFAMTYNGASNPASNVNPSYPGHAVIPGQRLSSLPPTLERSMSGVNQCLGHPTGSYACGRGATECCASTQNNSCFAGAYACSVSASGSGTKTACCISR